MSDLLFDVKLVVSGRLVNKVGLAEAIIVQQLHHLLLRSNQIHDGKRWVNLSYQDWNALFPFWSFTTIHRYVERLEEGNIIISRNAGDFSDWYCINYDLVEGLYDESQSARKIQAFPLGK